MATVAIVATLSVFAAVIGGWGLQSVASADVSPQLPALAQQTYDEQAHIADPQPASYVDEDTSTVDEQLLNSTRVKRDRPASGVQIRPAALGFVARDTRFDGTDTDIGLRDMLAHFCVARR